MNTNIEKQFLDESPFQYMLTLYCLARHLCIAVPKFGFYLRRDHQKKNSYVRRDYESVDEKSLS